jgi:hypothetical protein
MHYINQIALSMPDENKKRGIVFLPTLTSGFQVLSTAMPLCFLHGRYVAKLSDGPYLNLDHVLLIQPCFHT